MLRRDRQIRTQIHQVADACLFAVSFWMAYALRTNPQIIAWLNLDPVPPDVFDSVVWLYFALIPAAPLILESQGFYNRPALGPRRAIFWPLFKGCLITTIGLVLVMYILHFVSPRVVMMFFGVISFTLVYLKEELVRWALRSKFGQSQYKRRFILVGTGNEIARLRQELSEESGPQRRNRGRIQPRRNPGATTRAHAPRTFRQRRDHQRAAHLFRAGRKRHPGLRTRRRRGLAGRRFFRHANFAHELRRIARPSPAGLPHDAGSLLAGRRQASSWIFSARCSCWCC